MHNNILAIHSKTIGILLAVAGVTMLAIMHYIENENKILNLISIAMIIIGAGAFIAGMLKTAHTLTKKQTSLHQNDGAIAATALLRCMVAICIADNHLDEREIGMIAKIYKQLMNTDLDHETIINAAKEMQETDTDITTELASITDSLYEELRIKILKASLYILVADNDVDPREEETLEKIRKGLGYSEKKLAKAKESFLAERSLQSSN